MRQHEERVDIGFLAELLNFERAVAFMAIKDEQPTRSNYLAICILNKVL